MKKQDIKETLEILAWAALCIGMTFHIKSYLDGGDNTAKTPAKESVAPKQKNSASDARVVEFKAVRDTILTARPGRVR